MAKSDKYQPVTFTNSLGEVISNDPIFRAQQMLAQAGLDQPEVPTKAVSTPATSSDDEDLEPDVEEPGPYDDLKGKELKAIAAERGVDITGFTKVQQVRDALMAADAAADEANDAAEAESDTNE